MINALGSWKKAGLAATGSDNNITPGKSRWRTFGCPTGRGPDRSHETRSRQLPGAIRANGPNATRTSDPTMLTKFAILENQTGFFSAEKQSGIGQKAGNPSTLGHT